MPLVLVLLMGLSAAHAAAHKLSAGESKELENSWVRVLRVKHAGHEKAPMRQRPASVVVYLTDARLRTSAGEVAHKAGDVVYLNAGRSAQQNLADQPLEAVIIELKDGAAKSPPIQLDPVKLDPEHHLVPLENARVRVLRTILEPHLRSPMHEHPHYVVVYLTELHTSMKMGDGRLVDNPRRSGEVAWREALKHETENLGEHTAVEIQVEIK